MPFVPPSKKRTNLTDEVLSAMVPTKNGAGLLNDEQVPLLTAWRTTAKSDKVRFVCSYKPRRLVVDGYARAREQLGLWPDMTIEEARDKARQRMVMIEEQKAHPIDAPPFRKHRKHQPRMVRSKIKKRSKAELEALLAPEIPLTDEQRDRYERLMLVMMDAHSRASEGKGAERHDNGANFEDQPTAIIMDQVGDGFALGQAMKKLVESRKLDWERARNERLDAMVYIAASIIWKDQGGKA